MFVERENRTIRLEYIPLDHPEKIVNSCTEDLGRKMTIKIGYEGHGCAARGVVLDNIVIPLIVNALKGIVS
jgi:hypothetical protein